MWRHVRERTLFVERALALGEVKVTKTGQTRTVRLLSPLVTDLAEWRLACAFVLRLAGYGRGVAESPAVADPSSGEA